ncbi:MAG: hypothetical protein BWX87_00687 [Bacteroidetes bacterium ADurb.Bin123]|nr:MAG: hypothetical protein BWX87_00687 [Bacteroidetes bacterium ADurb.Bin123]
MEFFDKLIFMLKWLFGEKRQLTTGFISISGKSISISFRQDERTTKADNNNLKKYLIIKASLQHI